MLQLLQMCLSTTRYEEGECTLYVLFDAEHGWMVTAEDNPTLAVAINPGGEGPYGLPPSTGWRLAADPDRQLLGALLPVKLVLGGGGGSRRRRRGRRRRRRRRRRGGCGRRPVRRRRRRRLRRRQRRRRRR